MELSPRSYQSNDILRVNIESEGPIRLGAAVVIVNQNGEIWSVIDKAKPFGFKNKDRLSLPMETCKVGEGRVGNLLGAAEELVGDGNYSLLDSLHYVARSSYIGRFEGVQAGDFANMVIDIFVLVHDGEDLPLIEDHEVASVGWMKPEEFLASKDMEVRDLAGAVVGKTLENGTLNDVIQRYREGHRSRTIREFNIKDYLVKRGESHDWPGYYYSNPS